MPENPDGPENRERLADVARTTRVLLHAPQRRFFQQMLFSRIVPNCRKLGLLDAADGWLRARFTDLGVIGFEHLEDTAAELAVV